MQISLLYVTHPDKKHAEVLCKKLIDEHLIACANIFSIQSHYIWNGAHVDDGEFVSILKTLPQLVQKVRTRSSNSLWMRPDVSYPAGIVLWITGGNPPVLEQMTQSSGNGIGRVVFDSLEIPADEAFDHGVYLFLRSIAVARHCQLDLLRRVFEDFQSHGNGRRNRYPLGPSQLEHALHVLAVKRRLDRHHRRQPPLNELLQTEVDLPQFFLCCELCTQLHGPEVTEHDPLPP